MVSPGNEVAEARHKYYWVNNIRWLVNNIHNNSLSKSLNISFIIFIILSVSIWHACFSTIFLFFDKGMDNMNPVPIMIIVICMAIIVFLIFIMFVIMERGCKIKITQGNCNLLIKFNWCCASKSKHVVFYKNYYLPFTFSFSL